MESQPQNPELRINPENFHPWRYIVGYMFGITFYGSAHRKISFLSFKRSIMQQREIIQTKKYGSANFRFQRNPFIKFRNPNLNFFERTNEPTHTDKPKPICPSFFKIGGIKIAVT